MSFPVALRPARVGIDEAGGAFVTDSDIAGTASNPMMFDSFGKTSTAEKGQLVFQPELSSPNGGRFDIRRRTSARQRIFVAHDVRRGAFTLTELLVAIAIIAVLGALLLSQGKPMASRAQAVACVANLNQISSGLNLYVADNNGQLPPAALIKEDGKIGQWYNVLEPYLGTKALSWKSVDRPKWQLCPAKKFVIRSELTVGYGWNFRYFGHDNYGDEFYKAHNQWAFTRMAQVPYPAQTLIIGDSCDNVEPSDDFRHRYLYKSAADPFDANNRLLAQRHNGFGNYLFLDGHVEALSPAQLIANPTLYVRDK